jgi:RNA polymerase sigma-70 factor (ECF subfamily)
VVHPRDTLRYRESRRDCCEIKRYSKYTHVEISDLLGLPLGTVKGHLRLGLKRLKDHFGSTGSVSLPVVLT